LPAIENALDFEGYEMKKFLSLDVLRHELRAMGFLVLFTPLFVIGLYDGLGALMSVGNARQSVIGTLLSAGLESGLSLAAGMLIAWVTVHDTAIELQLTIPTPYRVTALRRYAVIGGWTAVVAIVTTLLLHLLTPWALSKPLGIGQLLWLAPTFWFAGVGAILALLLRSSAAAGVVLGGFWIGELLLHGYFLTTGWMQPWFLFATLYVPDASYWLINRLTLIGLALACFVAVWFFLRNSEWRLEMEDA
jgi:hypothetical protein